jgi:SAM-dependent methyltransferase
MKHVHTTPTSFQTWINRTYNFLYCKAHNLKASKAIPVQDFKTSTDSIHDAKPFVLAWLLNIRRSIRYLEKRIQISDFHYFDIGCGTGISTIYAGSWDFKSVIGFDFQSDFITAAKRNLIIGKNVNKQISFIEEDATNFKIKSPSILFFFNPFGPETLEKFIANNLREIEQGETWVILLNDRLLQVFLHLGAFELVNRNSQCNISILRGKSVARD